MMRKDNLGAEQSRAEQSRAEQSRAEQSRAEQSRAEQSRAEQSRALDICLFVVSFFGIINIVSDNKSALGMEYLHA